MLVENVGFESANLAGLQVEFPYRSTGELDLLAACTNPVLIGNTATNLQSLDLCDYVNITVAKDKFLVEFDEFMLCPHCIIDGMSDALSLFGIYDKTWQKLEGLEVSTVDLVAGGCLAGDGFFEGSEAPVFFDCNGVLGSIYNGTVLSKNDLKTSSPSECCDLCHNEPSCNVWTWCDGQTGGCEQGEEDMCVLKYEEKRQPQVLRKGKYTPWTSGFLGGESAYESCLSKVMALEMKCKDNNVPLSQAALFECCEDISNMNPECLCNDNFGQEMSLLQDSLNGYAARRCKLSPCEVLKDAQPLTDASPKSNNAQALPISGLNGLQQSRDPQIQHAQYLPIPNSADPRSRDRPKMMGRSGRPTEPDCGIDDVESALFMDSNANYDKIFLQGKLRNKLREDIVLGGFTIPIFFSRGARGYDSKWHRAEPTDFVVECNEVVVTSGEWNSAIQPVKVDCSKIKVEVTDDGILFTPVDINLCAGCSLEGLLGEPMWQVRHVNDFQLDFIHFKPASSANGPIIGKPFCIGTEEEFALLEASELSGNVLRDPSQINTAQDLLLGQPTATAGNGVPGRDANSASIPKRIPNYQPIGQPMQPTQSMPPSTVSQYWTTIRGMHPHTAASVLSALPPAHAAQILQLAPPPFAAQVMEAMPEAVASDVSQRLQQQQGIGGIPTSAQPIGLNSGGFSSQQQQPAVTAEQMALLAPSQAASLLQSMNPAQAASALSGLSPMKAAQILEAMPPADAAKIMDAMPGGEIAQILMQMNPRTRTQVLNDMSPVVGASALQLLPPRQAEAMLDQVNPQHATQMQNAMPPASMRPDRLALMSPAQAASMLQNMYPTQAAAALRGMSPREAAQILQAMPPMDAAQILDVMPGGAVADILMQMSPAAGSQLLGNMSPVVAASALQQLPPQDAQGMIDLLNSQRANEIQSSLPIDNMNLNTMQNVGRFSNQDTTMPSSWQNGAGQTHPSVSADELALLAPAQAASALSGLSPVEAAQMLQVMPPADAAKILDVMPGGGVANILRHMTPAAGSQLLGNMSPIVGGSALQQLNPQQAEAMLNQVNPQQATLIQNAIPPASLRPGRLAMLPPDQAASILQDLYPTQAAAALRGLSPREAAEILQAMPPTDAAQILDTMPGGAVADILTQMSPAAGSQLLANMSPDVAASALQQLPPQDAQTMLNLVNAQRASQLKNPAPAGNTEPNTKPNGSQFSGQNTMPPSSREDSDGQTQNAFGIQRNEPSVTADQLALLGPVQAASAVKNLYPFQAASALSGLSPVEAARILQAMPPADAAKIMDAMPGQEVTDILMQMDPALRPQILGNMSPVVGASALQLLPPRQAEVMLNLVDPQHAAQVQHAMPPASMQPDQLTRLAPPQAASLLQNLYPTQAAAALRGLTPREAAQILQAMPAMDAAQILDTMPGGAVADILMQMSPAAATQLLGNMSPVVAASALQQLPQKEVQSMLKHVGGNEYTGIGVVDLENFKDSQNTNSIIGGTAMSTGIADKLNLSGGDSLAAQIDTLSEEDLLSLSMDKQFPSIIEGLVRQDEVKTAVEILSKVPEKSYHPLFSSLSPETIAELIQHMEPIEAASSIALLDNKQVADVLTLVPESVLNSVLIRLPVSRIALVFDQMDPSQVAHYMNSKEHSVNIADVISFMDPERAARALEQMDPYSAAVILEKSSSALPIIEELTDETKTTLIMTLKQGVNERMPEEEGGKVDGNSEPKITGQDVMLVQNQDCNLRKNDLNVLLRPKLGRKDEKYVITGSIQREEEVDAIKNYLKLDSLGFFIKLSPWFQDGQGIWMQQDDVLGGENYAITCQFILMKGSNSSENLCKHAVTEVLDNAVVIHLRDVSLCPDCSLTGGPDGVLFDITRGRGLVDSTNLPVLSKFMCLDEARLRAAQASEAAVVKPGTNGIPTGNTTHPFAAPVERETDMSLGGDGTQWDISGAPTSFTLSFSPWTKGESSVWEKSSPGDFEIGCACEVGEVVEEGGQIQATIRGNSNTPVHLRHVNAHELDPRNPIIEDASWDNTGGKAVAAAVEAGDEIPPGNNGSMPLIVPIEGGTEWDITGTPTSFTLAFSPWTKSASSVWEKSSPADFEIGCENCQVGEVVEEGGQIQATIENNANSPVHLKHVDAHELDPRKPNIVEG